MGERMKIDENEARHVATLAELAVDDAELPRLARQLEEIVNFVAQLDEAPATTDGPVLIGPSQLTLREDIVDPIPLDAPPDAFAPAWQHGFFVVPRLGGVGEG